MARAERLVLVCMNNCDIMNDMGTPVQSGAEDRPADKGPVKQLENFTDLILEEGRRSAPFTIHAESRSGIVYLVIQGSMNLIARDRFTQEIGRFFAGLQRKVVVLDLNRCVRLSSSALGVLLAMHDAMVALGGTMIMLRPNPHILHVLGVLGLEGFWPMVEDEAAAESLLRSEGLLGPR